MSIDGLDFRSCNTMDLITKENAINAFLDLSDHLGRLFLKEEQKLAVEALLSGKDVMAVLPEIDHISKLRNAKRFNSSFPVVLRHVLNYASG